MAIYCSSSIANFREKVLERFRHNALDTYVGMYHVGDYARLLARRHGVVIWCGGDILNLQRSLFRYILPLLTRVVHVCENEVEQKALEEMGIRATAFPLFFSDKSKYTACFKPTRKPHVYACMHPGREREYGLYQILAASLRLPWVTFHIYGVESPRQGNVIFHGKVSEEQFDQEIRKYHSCLRLNTFDGFGDAVAKSLLLGQYPITAIRYPHVDHAPDLKRLIMYLRGLRHKRRPNPAQKYWRLRL